MIFNWPFASLFLAEVQFSPRDIRSIFSRSSEHFRQQFLLRRAGLPCLLFVPHHGVCLAFSPRARAARRRRTCCCLLRQANVSELSRVHLNRRVAVVIHAELLDRRRWTQRCVLLELLRYFVGRRRPSSKVLFQQDQTLVHDLFSFRVQQHYVRLQRRRILRHLPTDDVTAHHMRFRCWRTVVVVAVSRLPVVICDLDGFRHDHSGQRFILQAAFFPRRSARA
mmetsp:Transcript_22527/g.56947  ORF Transcript_22527/g.56947 Transcript_22527/m.56947 type:complete len:223 (+) Transcript_22527:772-1440(+)